MGARRPLLMVGGQLQQMTAAEFADLRWQIMPVGMAFAIWSHLAGVDIPPNDNPNYRYIKLTASDSYNDGVLTSESVSGSAPLVQATAVINDARSPMNGQAVRLINTEGRVIRAGNSGTVLADALQNITAQLTISSTNASGTAGSPSGAFQATANPDGVARNGGTVVNNFNYTFDASRVARTADETRVKSIGADYFMRIR